MNCVRCGSCGRMAGDMPETYREQHAGSSVHEDCQSDQDDIGGFAGITGCLHKLKSSEKQVSQVDNWKTILYTGIHFDFLLLMSHLYIWSTGRNPS